MGRKILGLPMLLLALSQTFFLLPFEKQMSLLMSHRV